MYHDGDRNSCGDTREIMSSQVSGQADLYHWSYCSKEYIQEYLKYEFLIDQGDKNEWTDRTQTV